MNFQTQTVTSVLSTAEAARFSGRYETTMLSKNGTPVKVTRSIRKANLDELLIQGSITPTRATARTRVDEDELCDLFDTKVAVTKSPKVLNKIAQAVDSAKLRHRSRLSKSCSDSEEVAEKKKVEKVQKKAPKSPAQPSVSPVRRSRRLSGCTRTRFGGVEE
jgi:hypothetical protein